MQAFVTLLYCTLMYFITGYQSSAEKYLIFVVTCILFQLISETLGSVCAILTKTATMGILLSSTLLMVSTLELRSEEFNPFQVICLC